MSEAIGLFGEGSGPILLDDVGCSADSADLAACYGGNIPWASHNCIPIEAVGLTCTANEPVNGGKKFIYDYTK